jgi:acyl carrier protein
MGLNEEALVQLRRLIADSLHVSLEIVNLESGPSTLPEWDSYHHIHLMVTLEERYKIELDMDEIMSMISVREIARVLGDRAVATE